MATLKMGKPFFAARRMLTNLQEKEKQSGRIDELAEEYFFKYLDNDNALAPAA